MGVCKGSNPGIAITMGQMPLINLISNGQLVSSEHHIPTPSFSLRVLTLSLCASDNAAIPLPARKTQMKGVCDGGGASTQARERNGTRDSLMSEEGRPFEGCYM